MTQAEQAKAAKEFAEFWADKDGEKQYAQQFWTSLLRDVYGVAQPEKVLDFEKHVKVGTVKFIDGYIAETRTLIEQKGAKINLDEAEGQSDGEALTPYQQAKRYDDNLPRDEKSRWIVVSNFREIRIHNMNQEEPGKSYERVMLADLPKEYYRLQFLVDQKNENIRREEEISIKAGRLVEKLYDALYKEFIPPAEAVKTDGNPLGLSESQLRSLNILCVRIVFCLYAEDAGLFASRTAFEDFIKSFNLPNVRKGLIELFKALDTPTESRDQYDESLKPFPYVNGGLFKDENIEIPTFTQEIVDTIVKVCAPFNWSEISPTIFGAVFESTLNPETRRKGGMHYTSIQNIHKVIDPLFMDGLKAELAEIKKIVSLKERRVAISAFQDKISSLTFLDPACGSGNFLTESYLSLAKLEMEALEASKDTGDMFVSGQAKVDISQFYGIEINDFAVTVAKTALWIAESQVANVVNEILIQKKKFLPLTTNAFIMEGNALRLDWATLKPLDADALPAEGLFTGFTSRTDGTAHTYDYIMGNPPFVGARWMEAGSAQKLDMEKAFAGINGSGNLDYVCAWYKRASELIKCSGTKAAFVSTNSITQGEQAAILWKLLFADGFHIDFAWRTFKWDSESTEKAHVHCVIVGFSHGVQSKTKRLFNADGTYKDVGNINGYLLDASNTFIESVKTPLCDVPEVGIGNKPIDGGNYIFTQEEKYEFLKKEPKAEKYFHQYIGSEEFINGKIRYILWLGDCQPSELFNLPECMKRVDAVRNYRLASTSAPTVKLAEKPTRFHVENFPKGNYIVIPQVSSERRKYIPIGYLDENVICSDKVRILPNGTLYHFGILTSNVHNAWMRAICCRLKSDYSYTVNNVYNTFPWPPVTDTQKAKIEQTAQAILDARAKYPDCTFAQLYGDKAYMFSDLVKAHEANDRAVMSAYGFDPKMSESEIVSELFKLYEKLSKGGK